MKLKVFLLFVFLSVRTCMFGQSPEYAYLVKTEVVGSLHANFNNLSITSDAGGGGNKSYQATVSTEGNVYYDFMSFPSSFTKITVDVYSQAIRLGQFPDCEYRREEIITKENFNSRGILSYGGCSFTHAIYPLHILGPDVLEPLCTRDVIQLKGGYDWQYYIGSKTAPTDSDWKDYALAKANISVDIGALYAGENININELASNAQERILKFRTGHKNGNKYVAPVSYSIIGCSPKFQNYYNHNNTSCSYKNDGSISFNVDRDIDTNERLVVTLYNSDGVLVTQKFQETPLTFNGVSNYGYVWPNQLDPDTYYFLYQTQNKSLAIPTPPQNDDGSSWDKLVKTPNFEIKKAVNVNFTATHLNDESCFASGDGKIQLNITSGETSTYKYIIYKVEGASETIYRNWTTFSGNNTIIENLEKNKYRIKVQDNKNCFARL